MKLNKYLIKGKDLDLVAYFYGTERKVLNRVKLPFNIVIIRTESDRKLRKRIIDSIKGR